MKVTLGIDVTVTGVCFVKMYSRGYIDVEASRLAIDLEKNKLQELTRQLNSRRNEIAPISSLPPELLSRIFSFVIVQLGGHFNFANCLNFTYVSQSWRKVALGTPNLWRQPPLKHKTWAKVYLERSKMTDLVIDTAVTAYNEDLVKEIFDNHATRIRELDLRGLTPSLLSRILENVRPSSLHLYLLDLSVDFGYEETVFCADYLAQPTDLRRLRTRGCSFDLFVNPPRLLTHLEIYDISKPPLLSELATALSEMPAIESIIIFRSLPLADKAVKLDLKVELPKLSLLNLTATQNVFEVSNILDFLIVPNTTSMRLRLGSVGQPSNVASQFDRFFSCMTGNADAWPYKTLHLEDDTRLGAWREERQDYELVFSLPDLSITFNPFNLLDAFVPILPLDLRTLIIGNPYGHRFFLNHVGTYTTLQILDHYSGFDLAIFQELLQALAHKPEGFERLESAYYDVPLPALHSLTIRTSEYHLSSEDLFDVLTERYERGAGLQKLSIRSPYIEEADIRRLREIVVDVEWDVYELSDVTDDEDEEIYEDDSLYDDYVDDYY